MKAIALQTPVADNGGQRRDAGEVLTVGDDGDAITLVRAEALVAVFSALDVTPVETPAKPAKSAD